ncbi:nitrogen fixation protein NifX [Evansella caseinilytica]|uniref:Nitrogen fixation protein NifX n=1 Tax=Evansella caseinilytica TaxID=1503961 RepID=A0A1H3I9U9_9BACI|nr:nitrogen fixation protein NifX [Evansella caseinilytica]SDY24322.1 nitrogen fixation protein NifX [Evansella caseinilytica]
MKVAFASNDGVYINTHFGLANSFEIYDISAEKYHNAGPRFVMNRDDQGEGGRLEERVNSVADCTLLFITQIGPAAAARVTRSNIMPIKVDEDTRIVDQLERLQQLLKKKPPMWLAKAMNEKMKNGDFAK